LRKQLESKMNKTTVYRILDKLMEDGIVHSFIGQDGLKWYAKCNSCSVDDHYDLHPHFQCNDCGDVECLPNNVEIPRIQGYKVNSANILMAGLCANCHD